MRKRGLPTLRTCVFRVVMNGVGIAGHLRKGAKMRVAERLGL